MANYVTDTIKVGDKVYEATQSLCGSDGGSIETETLTVEPTTSSQTLYPNTGKLINQVNVNAVTNNIDNNIQPDNIKKDVNILGIIGTLVPSSGIDGLQWKCDTMKSLAYEFYNYLGGDYSVLYSLDTSNVEDWKYCFASSPAKYGDPIPDLSNLDLSKLNLTNAKNLSYAFSNTNGLENVVLDLPNAEVLSYMFYSQTGNFPHKTLKRLEITLHKLCNLYCVFNWQDDTAGTVDVIVNNSKYITNFNSFALYSKSLKTITDNTNENGVLDFQNNTTLRYSFNSCSYLTELHVKNTQKVTDFDGTVSGCQRLETLETLDMISYKINGFSISGCTNLKNLIVKNVKLKINLGGGSATGTSTSSYGHLLTNASLLNVAQELWDNTDDVLGGSRTITLSSTSKTNIQSIYVKLVDVTDEMIAQDEYITNKKPCVECESTDDGAMTLEEYIISKNWSIA